MIDSITLDMTGAGAGILRAWQTLALPREQVFPFFADAGNLARITPAEMGFEITSAQPIVMQAGALIDYRIRVWGMPLRWRTIISRWDPPNEFVDEQLRGPYAEWIHRHRFSDAEGGGTLMEDEVRFRLPFGVLGAVAAPLIRWQLRRIFEHRHRAVEAALVSSGAGGTAAGGSCLR